MSIASEITRLQNAKSDIKTAIESKGVEVPSNAKLDEYDTYIENISGGGSDIALDNDVNFYDYDGTIVKSYTKDDFLELTSMPDNPTHEDLISQGWNWTLEEAKDFVSEYGYAEIGQMYKPSDDKIHIFTTLYNDYKTPYVGFAINGTATIEWGDGTTDNVSGSSTSTYIYIQHTYSTSGKYEIKISSNTNIYLGGSGNSPYLLTNSTTPSTNNIYKETIEKIYLSSNVYINSYSFIGLSNLKYIIIPKDIFSGNLFNVFKYCYSLKHINIMATTISNFKSTFNYCSNLKSISVGGQNARALVNNNTFDYCGSINKIMMTETAFTNISTSFCSYSSIKKFVFSENIETISSSLFQECKMLKEIVFPKKLNSISNSSSMFSGCNVLNKLDFSKCTSVPTTTTIILTQQTYKIIVPDSLYEDWIVASNWSAHASHIVKASEYIE